jgi:hypothetical protein
MGKSIVPVTRLTDLSAHLRSEVAVGASSSWHEWQSSSDGLSQLTDTTTAGAAV